MRILLAVDGSASSIDARDLVAGLPWPTGTTVTMLSVHDIPVGWYADTYAPSTAWLGEVEEGIRQRAEEVLAELAGPLDGRGLLVERRVERGRPASMILQVASELDTDLVVLGSRGHGPISTMVLGSVSAEVAEQARRPVLVVRDPTVAGMVVGTDGSGCSLAIAAVLADLGAFRSTPASVVSVAPPVESPTYELLLSLYSFGESKPEAPMTEQHQAYADELAAQLRASGMTATPVVRDGDAAHELIAAAEETGANLIVTGSHCRRGLDRWLLGSVARNVLLHARASVLIARRPDEPAEG